MSRAIQIRVSESVVRTVHVEDGVQSQLEMLPILARERQGELLSAELEKRGFVREGNVSRRRDADGLEISVDLKTLTVTVRLGGDVAVEVAVERTGSYDEDFESQVDAEAELRAEAREGLNDEVERQRAALQRQTTRLLERRLEDVRRELDAAVGQTTVEALTEKARGIGHVESVVSDGAGNVAIRVKL